MKKIVNIRPIIVELFKQDDLVISYTEFENDGFDLSVRIDKERSKMEQKNE